MCESHQKTKTTSKTKKNICYSISLLWFFRETIFFCKFPFRFFFQLLFASKHMYVNACAIRQKVVKFSSYSYCICWLSTFRYAKMKTKRGKKIVIENKFSINSSPSLLVFRLWIVISLSGQICTFTHVLFTLNSNKCKIRHPKRNKKNHRYINKCFPCTQYWDCFHRRCFLNSIDKYVYIYQAGLFEAILYSDGLLVVWCWLCEAQQHTKRKYTTFKKNCDSVLRLNRCLFCEKLINLSRYCILCSNGNRMEYIEYLTHL